ncbi:MAG: hypothetical protein HZA28_00360 [Candidatus Omnitrophica bacterium]|nr:hypothetical protein [Candidatus Omnitrophota bacterium]
MEVEAYFYKEDNIWVKALAEPEEYSGLFVTKPKKDTLSMQGEYFGFIFVPLEMKPKLRSLRGGDPITIRGKCFHFQASLLDGPGIEAAEILSGWGKAASSLEIASEVNMDQIVSSVKKEILKDYPPAGGSPVAAVAPIATTAGKETTYTLYLNGKEYQGLSFGNEYIFEGIHFQVNPGERE